MAPARRPRTRHSTTRELKCSRAPGRVAWQDSGNLFSGHRWRCAYQARKGPTATRPRLGIGCYSSAMNSKRSLVRRAARSSQTTVTEGAEYSAVICGCSRETGGTDINSSSSDSQLIVMQTQWGFGVAASRRCGLLPRGTRNGPQQFGRRWSLSGCLRTYRRLDEGQR